MGSFIEQLLVGLVSSYRYEGSHVNEDRAKSEAKSLHNAINKAGEKHIENDDVIRILTTRSKPHLKLAFKFYQEMFGKSIEEVCLQLTKFQPLQC